MTVLFVRTTIALVFAALVGVTTPPASAEAGTASISGRVLLSDGTPAAGVWVYGYLDDALVDGAVTADDGTFVMPGLEAGTWKLRIDDAFGDAAYGFPAEWYEDAETRAEATEIPLSAGQSRTGIAIEVPLGGTISGTVTDDGGQPLADICVLAYDVGDFYAITRETRTDAQGGYTLDRLVESLYSVGFIDCDALYGVAPEAYPDVDVVYFAAPLGLPQSTNLTDIDAEMQVPGTLRGRVLTPGGEPVAGACVTARTAAVYDTEKTAVTGADGSFELVGVRPGPARMKAAPCESSPPFATSVGTLLELGGGEAIDDVDVTAAASDSTPPDTAITDGPSDMTTETLTQFSFEFDSTPILEAESFECRYNDSVWYSCFSPARLNSVRGGTNTFQVRAIDGSGNVDPTPASWSFEYVDTEAPPPNTTITSGPAAGAVLTDTSTSISFTGTASATSFQCRLDTGGWQACTSPWVVSGLTDGSHTVAVRAVDAADQPDPTPATRSFTVDLVTCTDYESALDQANADLAAATQRVSRAAAALKSADRAVAKAKAALKKARTPAAKKKAKKALTAAKQKQAVAKQALTRARAQFTVARDRRDEAQDAVDQNC